MKLFTKSDDKKLFANYPKGSSMTQNVVVKIFNPYGKGYWFIMNSDPNDPDYLWGIVDLGYGAEVGSISRSQLENYRNRFGLGFERDTSFDPIPASDVLEGLRIGKTFANGGKINWSEYYKNGGKLPAMPPKDENGVRKIDAESIERLTDFINDLPQTKSMHFDTKKGDYRASRKKLHAKIINQFKKDVVCITNGQPIAILMGGSPASGKSSFLKKYSPFLLSDEILKIDADEIRAKLPEYEGYNASQTHLETKDIVNILVSDKNIGIPCDFDLIYDGTMNSIKSYIPLVEVLKKRGYKIFIVYMDNVPKEVITKRILERYQKSGRFVPLEVVDDFFDKGKTAFNELKKSVDGFMVVDGSSQDYVIIERGGMNLPKTRKYSKLGEKITANALPSKYEKGGLTSRPDYKYYYGVDLIQKVVLKDGTEIYQGGMNGNQIISGIHVSDKKMPELVNKNQLKLFEKGGKLPVGAKYIDRNKIDYVVIYSSDNDENKIEGQYLFGGIWVTNKKQQKLADEYVRKNKPQKPVKRKAYEKGGRTAGQNILSRATAYAKANRKEGETWRQALQRGVDHVKAEKN